MSTIGIIHLIVLIVSILIAFALALYAVWEDWKEDKIVAFFEVIAIALALSFLFDYLFEALILWAQLFYTSLW